MMKFLKNLSIKYQVWGGFFVILLLMIIIAAAATISLNATKEQALSISNEAQPAMVSALELQSQINYSASLMGLYIINNSPEYSNSYHSSLKQLQMKLDSYKQLTQNSDDSKLKALTEQLSDLMTEYLKIQKTLDYLTQNYVENFPALKISNQKINPAFKESMQIFDAMIESEIGESTGKNRRQLLIDINQLRHNWMSIVAAFRTFLAAPNTDRIAQVKLYIELNSKLAQKLQAHSEIFTFEQEEGFESIKNNSQLYFSSINQVFEIFNNKQWRKDSTLIRTQLGPLMEKISATVSNIVEQQSNSVSTGNQQLIKQISNTSVVLIALSLIALVVGVFIALTSSQQVTTITREIKTSLQHMSAGDFTIELNENRVGEVGMISGIINNFASQLSAMMKEMQMATDKLLMASSQMSTVTHETSNNIQQQHRETEMVATAVEQMTATAQEVAANASSAADSARQANQQSQDGAYASSEALGGINHLVNDLNNASGVIQNLQTESENIGVVLDVISSISEQTNLLALNAAIEAARAGEQGRGFAVVADEVRTLASRTQESTNQIKELIDKLQIGSSDAVDAMGRAIKEVNINSEQVERVAEALGGIAGEIVNINGMLDQMAAASEQQSATAEEISRNIVSISQLAELTSQGTENLSSAETELRGVSDNLGNIISNFKT